MTKTRTLFIPLALLGCVAMLSGLFDLLRTSYAFAEQIVSDERLQAIELVHKQNIGQLHSLHHEMRAFLKQLTGRNDQEAARQLAIQLRAVTKALDTIAATEKDHPQWTGSWSQRHARLVVLTQEMETLLTGPGSRDHNRSLDELGKNLQEMKEILNIW